MYADDTDLQQNIQDNFQSDFNQIQCWLQANRLQLNISKSVVMLIGCVASTRYLGVNI